MVLPNSLSSYYEKFLATGEVKCIDEEIPFEIPKGWEWERWGNIALSIQYGYNAPALERGDIKMVRISDIHDNVVQWENVPFCNIEAYDIDTYLLKENDILFARTGGTVGKSFLVQSVPEPAIYAGYLIRTRYSKELCPQYLKSFMESRLYWEQLKSGTIATAQPNCNGKTLGRMLLPIPPKAEQSRLVQKLASFTPIFQRYAKTQQDLDNLNESIDDKLKKSILQEAIQGRLVPQITEEGTAQELLEQIKLEKLQLIKEGKLKKSALVDSVIYKGDDNKYFEKIGKTEQDITDEIPFDIPNTWVWVRHNDLFDISGGSQPPKSKFIEREKEGYIRLFQIRDYGSNPQPIYIPLSTASKISQKGDILLARYGASLGKVFYAEYGAYNVALAKVIPLYESRLIFQKYIFLYYCSSIYQNEIVNRSRCAQAGFNKEDLNSLLFPLPPLSEQYRIVEKYEKAIASIMRG
ncbi:restriction endonuclease subunit S [Phocaeicola vulgatus]|uniref:restriction endonuclease subunit S n=1 Tax=Phocaeicola vulgatus TaxID=821 RepID=UPI00325EA603